MYLELNYEGFEQYFYMKRYGKGYNNYNVLYAFDFGDGRGALVHTDSDNRYLWEIADVIFHKDRCNLADMDIFYHYDDSCKHLTNGEVIAYLNKLKGEKL